MKVTIKLNTGASMTGAHATDLVHQLKMEDWTSHLVETQYKDNMSRRVKNFYGETISYANDEEFIDELTRVGFIKLKMYHN